MFGSFDRAATQRGFQVYREVCAACHGLKYVTFRNLETLGYSEGDIKAIAAEYTITDGPNDQGEMFERPGQPFDLVDQDRVDPAGPDVREQPLRRAVHRAAGEAAIVIAVGQGGPALVLLAEDIGGAGLALRVERVERLLQPLGAALAGVDRAADRPGSARHGATRSRRPKKAGPLRRLPVISRAMTESERQSRPRQ